MQQREPWEQGSVGFPRKPGGISLFLSLTLGTTRFRSIKGPAPMDCSPPGSSVHGILQARILEWVAISFSRGSSQPRDWTQVSRIASRCFNLWAKFFFLQGPGSKYVNLWKLYNLSCSSSTLLLPCESSTHNTYTNKPGCPTKHSFTKIGDRYVQPGACRLPVSTSESNTVVAVQSLSHIRLFATPWTSAC